MEIDILKTGDDLEKAFLEFNGFIYRYILIRVNYQKEVAEDLTQDVFVKAWKNRLQFNSEKSSMKNWLFLITKSTLIDYFRKNRNAFVQINVFDLIEEGFEDKVIDKVMFNQIIENFNLLKENEKNLLILRYVEELEIKEIARLLGKSQIATKVGIHRAMNTLKKLVNNHERT